MLFQVAHHHARTNTASVYPKCWINITASLNNLISENADESRSYLHAAAENKMSICHTSTAQSASLRANNMLNNLLMGLTMLYNN